MNKAILKPEVQNFIREQLGKDVASIILKGSPFPDVSIQDLAIQINGLQKAKTKFPALFQTDGIIFPPNINLEQTSSEVTARYKASLTRGKTLADITGGLGIDTYYFSEKFERVYHLEINPDLSAIATHNFERLGINNIIPKNNDGLDFIRNFTENFDWIYLDPARRDDHGGKVFLLEQCTPDVTSSLELLFSKSDNVLVKTSPLLDLTAGVKDLNNLKEIHIVSVNSEVKELLWVLKKEYSGKILIQTVNFQKEQDQYFNANFTLENKKAPLSLPLKFLYEPNSAIMKSGLFAEVVLQTETLKLHVSSHLYTSEKLVEFPGRRFEIIEILPYSKNLKKHPAFKKANITTRNFPKQVSALRKEMKIADGGDIYLFFTTNQHNEKIVLVCKKV